ncbi:MAG: bifunctional adenosylcobinamide kinase/adenosylcobinamide-phosphate guanylyltransferase [Gammaproteobacteria bacterium]|nr:bifunctional adenosylcobinamide kinase/adenosylcobinamide-phosphate guanylyltransferase [Gammaproteobacteria bacterium]
MQTTLIVGGARSGKSRRALQLALEIGGQRTFIATAEASDAEMAERIGHHRAERGVEFRTREEPLDLVNALEAEVSPDGIVVVDCLTLWLSNLMHHGRDVVAQTHALVALLSHSPGPIVLVSNEVGMGLVPETRLGREFRDAQGELNREVAAVCGRVEFMIAGLPLTVKPA